MGLESGGAASSRQQWGESEKEKERRRKEGGREGAGVSTRGIWKGGQRANRQKKRDVECQAPLPALGCVLLLLFGGQDEQPVPAARCPYKPAPAQRGQDQPEGKQQGNHSHPEHQRRYQGGCQPALCPGGEGDPCAGRCEQQPEQEHPSSSPGPETRNQEDREGKQQQAAGAWAPPGEKRHTSSCPTHHGSFGTLALLLVLFLILLLHPQTSAALSPSPSPSTRSPPLLLLVFVLGQEYEASTLAELQHLQHLFQLHPGRTLQAVARYRVVTAELSVCLCVCVCLTERVCPSSPASRMTDNTFPITPLPSPTCVCVQPGRERGEVALWCEQVWG